MLPKRKVFNEELKHQIQGKNTEIKEFKKKLVYFGNMEIKNNSEIKRLSEQTQNDQ